MLHFDDSASFALALRDGEQELPLPAGETVGDGEWVLALFEIGPKKRATAAAGRGVPSEAGEPPMLAFERRDWDRLVLFADAGSAKMRATTPKPPPPSSRAPARTSQSSARLRATTTAAPGRVARILVVDDDRDIREVVSAMLDAVGLAVEAAPSAEEALERVRKSAYDLLVLDWNLPGMTGVELCRVIRRDTRLAALPVLFLTAHASSRDVVEAFASGADDFVVKPFRAPELGARIFGLLRRARVSAATL